MKKQIKKDDRLFEKILKDVYEEAKELKDFSGVDQYIEFKIKVLNEIFGKKEMTL